MEGEEERNGEAAERAKSEGSDSGDDAPPPPPLSEAPTTIGRDSKLNLRISFTLAKACKCSLCGSLSTDKNPLVNPTEDAMLEMPNRPWAKYRKVYPANEEPARVPEGRCCLPCLNVFRLVGWVFPSTFPCQSFLPVVIL